MSGGLPAAHRTRGDPAGHSRSGAAAHWRRAPARHPARLRRAGHWDTTSLVRAAGVLIPLLLDLRRHPARLGLFAPAADYEPDDDCHDDDSDRADDGDDRVDLLFHAWPPFDAGVPRGAAPVVRPPRRPS